MSCRKAQLLRQERSRINLGLKISEDNGLKVWSPHDLLKHIFDEYPGEVAVSCSFGRCSMIVLHMALQYDPALPVLFANTLVEFPETIKYKGKIVSEWNLNFYEARPEITFWECVERYGWPHLRSGKGAPRCCYHLKKKPLMKLYKECGCKVIIDGIRAGESSNRMMSLTQYGQLYFSKIQKVWKVHPIAWIDYNTVSRYLEQHNIPNNPVYEKGQYRSGCWCCTGYLNWEKELSKSHPKFYELLQKKRGQPLITAFT